MTHYEYEWHTTLTYVVITIAVCLILGSIIGMCIFFNRHFVNRRDRIIELTDEWIFHHKRTCPICKEGQPCQALNNPPNFADPYIRYHGLGALQGGHAIPGYGVGGTGAFGYGSVAPGVSPGPGYGPGGEVTYGRPGYGNVGYGGANVGYGGGNVNGQGTANLGNVNGQPISLHGSRVPSHVSGAGFKE